MPSKEDKAKYDMEYAKKNLKRIPLDVQKEKYDEIAAAAERAGKSVNGYIKEAIEEKMERDKQQDLLLAHCKMMCYIELRKREAKDTAYPTNNYKPLYKVSRHYCE